MFPFRQFCTGNIVHKDEKHINSLKNEKKKFDEDQKFEQNDELIEHLGLIQEADTRSLKQDEIPLISNQSYFSGIVPAISENSNKPSYSTDTMVVNPYFSRFNGDKNTQDFVNALQNDSECIKYHSNWQILLCLKLNKLLPRDREFIDRTYTIFIHLITHPDSPQIWRRIKVHGSLSMKQLSRILNITMGWCCYPCKDNTRQMNNNHNNNNNNNHKHSPIITKNKCIQEHNHHASEFRIQLKTLSNLFPNIASLNNITIDYINDCKKENYDCFKSIKSMTTDNKCGVTVNPLFDKYISIGNKNENLVDEKCWRWLLGQCFEMDEILVGQIAPLFQPFTPFKSAPNDIFMKKYYKSLYNNMSKYSNNVFGFNFDISDKNDNHLKNGIWDRFDCFQWVYDLGDQWIHNIYFECSEQEKDDLLKYHFINKNTIYCEYLNGFGMCPCDDIGGLQDYHLSLLKCHGSYSASIADFKTKNDIYNWMQTVWPPYYYISCLNLYDDNQLISNYISNNNNNKKHNKNKQKRWNPYCYKTGYENEIIKLLKQENEYLKIIKKQKNNLIQENNIVRRKNCCNVKCRKTSKKLKKCKACFHARYCSKKCQKIDWKNHKPNCHHN